MLTPTQTTTDPNADAFEAARAAGTATVNGTPAIPVGGAPAPAPSSGVKSNAYNADGSTTTIYNDGRTETTGGPKPPAASGADATPSGLGLTVGKDPNQDAIDAAQKAGGVASGFLDKDGNPAAAPDEATVRKNTMDQFQTQIDALNKAAADARARVSARYQKIDEDRVGSQRALLANSGMIGQVSGFSEKNNLDSANEQELNAAVDAEGAKYTDQVNALLGQARTMAADSYKSKLDAYTKGADATVQYLKDKQTTAKANAQAISKNAYAAGIDLTDPKNADQVTSIAKQLGISVQDLKAIYTDTKTALKTANQNKFSSVKDGAGNLLVFNETTGKYLDSKGNPVDPSNVDPTTVGTDPASVKSFLTGRPDEAATALSKIPDSDKGSIMQLVNGDALLTDIVKSRGLAGTAAINKIINEAMTIDPSFSVNANKQRYAFKTEWNNPNSKAYNTRASLNTATGHLAELKNVVNKLDGVDYKIANGVMQAVSKNLNTDQTKAIADFNYISNQLAIELGKAYNGGVPSDAETSRNLSLMNASNPKDVNASIINTASDLLSSLLTTQGTEYKNVMGKFPEAQVLQTDKLDALQAAGVDTSKITKGLVQQGMKASSVRDYEAAFPDAKSKVDKMVQENPGLSEQDVLQVLQGDSPYFNNVGADTNSGSDSSVKPTAYKFGSHLAIVNNNPGNLRFVGQPGATQGTGGFAKFSTPEAGVQALVSQINLDAGRGHTLLSFINKYAPPSENNTLQYVNQVSQRLGVPASTPLSKIDLKTLAKIMAQKESSSVINFA